MPAFNEAFVVSSGCTPAQVAQRVRADFAMKIGTGEILSSSNAHTRLAPASMTKQMTALLILEDILSGRRNFHDWIDLPFTHISGPGTYQTSDAIPWNIRKVSLYAGLFAMLRLSSNRVAQSFESPGFLARMNAKALVMKLRDTHYVNATGYPTLREQQSAGTAYGHYSSAFDIAQVVAELHRVFPDWMEKFAGARMDFTGLDDKGADVPFRIETTVNLLPGAKHGLDGVIDGKTCFICRAGHGANFVSDDGGSKIVWVTTGHATREARDLFMRTRLLERENDGRQTSRHRHYGMLADREALPLERSLSPFA